MIRLPDNNWRQAEVLASWVELSALRADNGFVPRGNVLNALTDSNLFEERGNQRKNDSTSEGSAAATASEIWKTLHRRQRLMGAAWPYQLTEESLTRRAGYKTLPEMAAYTTMLLIEAAAQGWYKTLTLTKSDIARTHFEMIVASSLSRVCGGRTSRFGAPFPKGWPKGFAKRVKYLAGLFGLSASEEKLGILATPQQQDGSLDVVVRWKIGDEEAASAYLFVQCATGKGWVTDKRGEPMMALWNEFVSWDGPYFKVIAVPFVVRDKHELQRASIMHERAIILDRFRIASGEPDKIIEAEFRNVLVAWCQQKFLVLPSQAA